MIGIRPLTDAEICKRYREKHPERFKASVRASTKRWRERDPEGFLEGVRRRQRRYRKRHPEQDKLYRKQHLEDSVRRTQLWQKRHPDAYLATQAACTQRRRTRKRNNGGSFMASEWLDLKTKYGNRCVCCGKTEKQLKKLGLILAPDHIKPLSKKGRNDIGNIQPLCHARKRGSRGGCNGLKRDKCIDYRRQG